MGVYAQAKMRVEMGFKKTRKRGLWGLRMSIKKRKGSQGRENGG